MYNMKFSLLLLVKLIPGYGYSPLFSFALGIYTGGEYLYIVGRHVGICSWALCRTCLLHYKHHRSSVRVPHPGACVSWEEVGYAGSCYYCGPMFYMSYTSLLVLCQLS